MNVEVIPRFLQSAPYRFHNALFHVGTTAYFGLAHRAAAPA
jgi:hypothetical protein